MNKTWILTLLIGLAILLSGCSAEADYDPSMIEDESGYQEDNTDLPNPDPSSEDPIEQGGTVQSDSDLPALLNRKIIYEADLEMAVLDPDSVYEDVMDTIDTYTAYVEAANITTERYRLTIRVLSSEFNAFLDDVKTTGELVSFSQTSEDITNAYSTFEARREALEARHDRILDLIATAVDLDTILELEDERYEIEAELNQIGDTLANYDSLVDYSTIDLLIRKAVEEIVVLPRTTAPQVYVTEVTKNAISLELYNHSDENVTINVDLYQNGEFIEQYEESTYADSKIEVTFDNLQSDEEYTIKITALASEHRVSLTDTLYRTTDPTYGNRTVNTFVQSWNLLITIFQGVGLVIVGLLPFAVTSAAILIPARILYVKKYRKPRVRPSQRDASDHE